MELRGRNAIVTGASRGIGVYIARTLAREGVNLALAARSADALEEVRTEVAALGVRAVAFATDVTDDDQLASLVERSERDLGPVDILVNNAGIEQTHRFDRYPPEEIRRIVDVNLTSPLLLTRLVLPGMLERGRGSVVNVASLAGKGGYPCQAPYAATKAGLVMFTHTLRAEYAHTPVRFSAVCPGFVADAGMYADMEAAIGMKAPRAMGTSAPQKVADAVVKAVRTGAVELLVNPTPIRPMLVLSQMFPELSSRVLSALGVTSSAREVADRLDG